jgi:hypothetical protein
MFENFLSILRLVWLRVLHSQSPKFSLTDLIQNYDGNLNFATDTWTSPNHCAYVAFTVHFIHGGIPISLPLDFIEVATVRTSIITSTIYFLILSLHLSCRRRTAPISPVRLPLFSVTFRLLRRYVVQYFNFNYNAYLVLVVGCHSRQCVCQ